MPNFVSERSSRFTESVIREMTRLAEHHDAINLAQGFPDLPCPKQVKDSAKASIDGDGFYQSSGLDANQYSLTWGTRHLREAIAQSYQKRTTLAIDPEKQVVVTCGATEAMAATMLAVVDPGEEVIVFEPFYENYGPDVALCGARPRFVRLREPDFHIDEEELRRAFNYNTKAIVINSPNNPTGKVFTARELELVASLCMEWDVLAITDEIYQHFVYDGRKHISLSSLPGMSELTITINSISKAYGVTGWRVGWAIAHGEIMDAIRKVHDFLTVSAPHPFQDAAVEALQLPDSYYEDLTLAYARRRDLMVEGLTQAGFRVQPPQGSYYIMADIAGFGYESDVHFAEYLVRELGVACVPGSSFYEHSEHGRSRVRFAFGRRPEVLSAACQRLRRLREI
ncbi:MAG: aminotransferase class I/II-fold pyridoxal phosphate-dependent enzyme [Acidobacteriota bacterium]